MATLIVPANASRVRLESVVEENNGRTPKIQLESIEASAQINPTTQTNRASPTEGNNLNSPIEPFAQDADRASTHISHFLQQANAFLPAGNQNEAIDPSTNPVLNQNQSQNQSQSQCQNPASSSRPGSNFGPRPRIQSRRASALSAASVYGHGNLPPNASRRLSVWSQSPSSLGVPVVSRNRRRSSAVSFATEVESFIGSYNRRSPSLATGTVRDPNGSAANQNGQQQSQQLQQQQNQASGQNPAHGHEQSRAVKILEALAEHGAKYIRPSSVELQHIPNTRSNDSLNQNPELKPKDKVDEAGNTNGNALGETPLVIGAAVCSIYAISLAFGIYAVLFFFLESNLTAILWGISAVSLLASLGILYFYQNYVLFTTVAQLAIDIPVFIGIIMGNVLLAIWMIPAVLFTATFSAKKGEWFTSFHMALLSLAYALIKEDVLPANDLELSDNATAAFCLFTLAFLLLLTGALMRFMHHQTTLQQADLQRANFYLKMQNRTLQSELRELKNTQTEDVIGTPAEKVIHILRSLLSDTKYLTELQRADLNLVIRMIGSNKLYNSSVAYANIKPADGVDAETQKWVLDQLVQKTMDEGEDAESETDEVIQISSIEDEAINEQIDKQVARINSRSDSKFHKRMSSLFESKRASLPKNTFVERMTDKITMLLEKIDGWNFDIIEFHQETEGRSLFVLANHLFRKYDFLLDYGIPEEVLKNFLTAVEEGYLNNPYHNSLHAADVLQSMHSLLIQGGLIQVLDPIETFSCLLATIIHDFRHPGVNNNFLVSTDDPLAIAFNDSSVLENYHASEGFKLMATEPCAILQNTSKDIRKKIRKIIIDIILCTDMSRHADIMGSLKNALSVGDLTGETFDSRVLLIKLAMKLCDISNPAKPPQVAMEWTRRISDEFYFQGDKEKEKLIPVSPFMDRNFPVVAKSQIGFISFVVLPLAELWNSAMGTGLDCLQNLSLNLEYWKAKAEEEQAATQKTNIVVPSGFQPVRSTSTAPPAERAHSSLLLSPATINPQQT